MGDPLEDHERLLSEQEALLRMKRAIAFLEASGCTYVVEGGWAVTAYGSPVGSVDLDVIYGMEDGQRLREGLLRIAGIQFDAREAGQLVGIDERWSDAPNALFTRPALSYVPRDLLKGRVEHRTLRLAPEVRAPVPALDLLAFMKAKAFHDRRLQWEAARDPVALAALDPEDQAWVRTHDVAYWERKAGKDLFDVAYLLDEGAEPGKWSAFVPDGMVRAVTDTLRGVPLPLRRFASGMAERHGLGRIRVPPTL